jgi:hypothetical protein
MDFELQIMNYELGMEDWELGIEIFYNTLRHCEARSNHI